MVIAVIIIRRKVSANYIKQHKEGGKIRIEKNADNRSKIDRFEMDLAEDQRDLMIFLCWY